MKQSAIITIATVALTFGLPLPQSNAGANHDHDHSHAGEIQIPATREELWKAIQLEHESLLKNVESQSDEAVHHANERLQAYLGTLPKKVSDLEEETRKRIEGQTRNLARVYDAIHEAAHNKAWDKASAGRKLAVDGMKLLAAQMPD